MNWWTHAYKRELIELTTFGEYEVEIWATRRGVNGDAYDMVINDIGRPLGFQRSDEEAVAWAFEWLRDEETVRREFCIG